MAVRSDHQPGLSLYLLGTKDNHRKGNIRFCQDLPTLPGVGSKVLRIQLLRLRLEVLHLIAHPRQSQRVLKLRSEALLPFGETPLPTAPSVFAVRCRIKVGKMVIRSGITVHVDRRPAERRFLKVGEDVLAIPREPLQDILAGKADIQRFRGRDRDVSRLCHDIWSQAYPHEASCRNIVSREAPSK